MMQYEYYDTPEGHDCFKKLFVTGKYAAAFGLGVSTFDVLMYSHPKGYTQTLTRYAAITAPLVAIAAAWTSGTYIATNIRGKDDHFNYLVGAACASGVLGAWRKSVMTGFLGCLGFGIASALKKSSIEDGWEFFPKVPLHSNGSLWGNRHDFTLTAERPGNWTTGKTEQEK